MHKRFPGRHKFVCDVDGMEYYSEDKVKRWDGAIVHRRNSHERHPQELIRSVHEDISVRNVRTEPDDQFVDGAIDPTFGLIDNHGNFITDNNSVFVQAPSTAATL